jgi:hypothetical protein
VQGKDRSFTVAFRDCDHVDRVRFVAVDLYAGFAVGNYERALAWYERLLGSSPSFVASATEAV